MKRTYKMLLWGPGSLIALVLVARVLMSHDAACLPPPVAAAGAPTAGAWLHLCYGGPESLQFVQIEKAPPAADELLVKVRAAAVNPLDWHYLRGKPYVMRLMGSGIGRPKEPLLGVDFAGVVEAVGAQVTTFKRGDEVFGARSGAFGEYLRVKAHRNVVLKPANVSFEDAAAVPVAALTALQALRDAGRLRPGEKVLINGASGGVGTYAVQIAKALGAEVTGVSSGRNVELVRSLGADHVIDYTRENFTARGEKYDLIVDNVMTHDLADYRRVLTPDARFVIVGSLNDGEYLGPMADAMKAAVYDPFVSQSFGFMMSEMKPGDLATLRDLMAAGKIRSVIDRTYPLSEVPEAIRYVESGRARGKVIVRVQ
jgi:NADPH:quinone reductase-like Zn-dependent oxidoreductase